MYKSKTSIVSSHIKKKKSKSSFSCILVARFFSMGNQQVSSGRLRSDTYTRYEREGEDGRYVTLEPTDVFDPLDDRVGR